jgi:predicted nucleic acid-binding protein
MSFVLDSSATLAWVYPDEMTPPIARLAEQVSEEGAWVPSLWALEIGNNLLLAVRHGRIGQDQQIEFLKQLSELNISTDPDTDKYAWLDTIKLAEQFRLPLYDACYLELAHRLRLPLATLDRDLRTAGAALGVELLGL